jgi:nucleoside-diphosphate-sugar epimerase
MYLVTGGAGFIGSHIVKRLVTMGEQVRVLDNLSFGKRENLEPIEDKIEFVCADILDFAAVSNAMQGVEVVLHQAALRSVPFSVENPVLVNRVNVEGMLNVLASARDAGARRVVYASSSSVYGASTMMPKSEHDPPNPISPYAVSKIAGEYYAKVFTKLYGLETVGLRYFNVYGPRQDPKSQYAAVIPRFIHWAFQGEPLEIHGDGLQSRDFTYIDNVVTANLKAAHSQQAAGGVFNVGQGKSHTLLEVIDEIMGTKLQLLHTPARSGDVRYTKADISESQRCLGYEPQVSFEDGLWRTLEFFGRQIAWTFSPGPQSETE